MYAIEGSEVIMTLRSLQDERPDITMTSFDEGDSEITDVDIDPALFNVQSQSQQEISIPDSPVPIKRGVNLMDLLSGNKKKKTRLENRDQSNENVEEVNPNNEDSLQEIEVINSTSTSISPDSDSDILSEPVDEEVKNTTFELESKIYANATKRTTAKDLFSSFNQQPKHKPTIPTLDPEPIEIDDRPTTSEIEAKITSTKKKLSARDILNLHKDKKPNIQPSNQENQSKHSNEVIEAKMFTNAKRTTAKDLFKSFKPPPPPKLEITLNIKPDKLRGIKVRHKSVIEVMSDEDEISNNETTTRKRTTAKELLGGLVSVNKSQKKPSLFITLKINPIELSKIKDYDNPLKTKGNLTVGASFSKTGKCSSSVFASMMQASKQSSKLTALQGLNELPLPDLTRDQFHVFVEDEVPECIEFPFSRRERNRGDLKVSGMERFKLDEEKLHSEHLIHTSFEIKTNISRREYALERLPELLDAPALAGLYDRFLKDDDIPTKHNILWVDHFKPLKMEELLMHPKNIRDIQLWITNSFNKLKSQSGDRLKNMKKMIKKRKQQQDSFIVYDDFEDGTTEEEIFSPFLILQGSQGSAKSSSIYTAMRQMNGYVHEINSGMARGRKDIYNSLKELCTTQLVHNNDTNEFQKGIVLLEDVNVLFEQDKTFWQVVQDIVNISKRPIVLTCEELWNIPKSLIQLAEEDDSIIFIDDYPVPKECIVQYLWLCCLCQGYDVDWKLLETMVDENRGHDGSGGYDLRKCLMACEILCKVEHCEDGIVVINESTEIQEAKKKNIDSLEALANVLEVQSAVDVINTGSISQIGHEIQPNELADIYYIDDTSRLKQKTLPFELNIGDQLETHIRNSYNNIKTYIPAPKYSRNDLRYECNTFIGSRSKKVPRYIIDFNENRRTLRSSSEPYESDAWTPEPTGIPDTSFLNHIPHTAFILDLLPIARYWERYQKSINKFEKEAIENGRESVKKFLNYRDFQYAKSNLRSTMIGKKNDI
ncbi:uncharacterized protein J8A68_002763 [[Candida] subhashii]|uniref:Uncharacterized protein n=1 Tax=[Candida] subhashii TaxID=561895 RepID=A0A8J5QFV2_9ASCO|nr:uncharacterized protein J8A68_002763 [[Candida] subhashii]KAG7663711.1 hypothetical protein J8A68_002763 [[Candida] subhashii]